MAQIALKGNPVNTSGNLPAVGSKAPDFKLTKTDLSDVSLASYAGKTLVLNIFPSVDTGVCASSVRHFNQDASKLENTAVLCISRDLPFAHARFCGAEGIEKVDSLSELRQIGFGEAYGLRMTDGPLAGLLSRAVVVVGADGVVKYTEQVPEITQEPNYEAALAAAKG
ncbi:MAG: thiol peroxidase [bacterium]|nr:thiol peroxidase [bacterium]